MPSIGSLSLDAQLKDAEEALSYTREMQRAQEDIVRLNTELVGQSKEMQENRTLTSKTMEHLTEVYSAHNNLLRTQMELHKDRERIENDIMKIQDKMRLNEESSIENHKKLAGVLTNDVLNPSKGVASAFESIGSRIPQIGIALAALSPLLNEFTKSLHEIREITYTGGAGAMEGMGGVGGMAALQMQMRFAAMEIPGLKERYASREEMGRGAGIMFGMGGLRGDELLQTMEGLPKIAHEVGMNFTEVSEIMAKSHRVLKQSPEEMRMGFQEVIDSAKEAGVSVREYAQTVYTVTMETARYGFNQKDVNDILGNFIKLVESGSMSMGDFQKFMHEEARARKDSADAFTNLSKLSGAAEAGFYKVSEGMTIQQRITETLVPVMKDYSEAMKISERVQPLFTQAIVEGTMQLETLTAVLPDLISRYKFSDKAIEGWMMTLTAMSKETGVAAPELARNIMTVSGSISKMFDSPTQALFVATDAVHSYSRMIKNGQMTFDDFTRVIQNRMDVFGMSAGGARSEFDVLTDIVRKTNMRMEELVQYTGELSKTNKQYGFDLEATRGTLFLFNEQMRAGAIGLQDLQSFAKGPAGGTEGFKALVAQRLGQTGAFGGMFGGRDVLTQIELLRDVQDAMSPQGTVSPLLASKMKESGMSREDLRGKRDVYMRTYQDILTEFSQQSGESPQVMFKKLTPILFGTQISAVGGALDVLFNLFTGQDVNVRGVLGDQDIDRIAAYQKKHKLPVTTQFKDPLEFASIISGLPDIKRDGKVDHFGSSVDKFGNWVSKLMDPAEIDRFGRMYKTPEEQAFAQLARDASRLGIQRYAMTGADRLTGKGGRIEALNYTDEELRSGLDSALQGKSSIAGLTPEVAKSLVQEANKSFEQRGFGSLTKDDIKTAVADGYSMGMHRTGGEKIHVTTDKGNKVSKQSIFPTTPVGW